MHIYSLIYNMCVHVCSVCVCTCTHITACVWRPAGDLQMSVLSFHHEGISCVISVGSSAISPALVYLLTYSFVCLNFWGCIAIRICLTYNLSVHFYTILGSLLSIVVYQGWTPFSSINYHFYSFISDFSWSIQILNNISKSLENFSSCLRWYDK